jgi:putative transposase
MKEVAGKRRRFGYRRIGIMLERQGMTMNHKKLYRLYREEGLSVRRRRGRKRARGSRTPMPVPLARGSLVDGLCVRHLRRITQVPDFGHQ